MNSMRDLSQAKLSCVLPVYNEGAQIEAFVRELYTVVKPLAASVEMILVNDGSKDNTAKVLNALLDQFPIRVVNFSRNFGKEAAITAGLELCSGDAVLLMDTDFQHPIAMIPKMMERWQAGVDMVYGVINDRSSESFLKRLGTKSLYRIINVGSQQFEIPANAGDFRFMDARVVRVLRSMPERNRFMKGIYAWVGFKSEPMYFAPLERMAGSSSFNLQRLSQLAINGITSFSTLPLYISTFIGMAISILAIAYGIFVLINTYMDGNSVPGWTTIVVALMFFSGLQFILIGILGKYIGQIFEEIKGRPIYVVDSDLSSPLLQPSATESDHA